MTNRSEKQRVTNEKSILLSETENNDIFNSLGKGCFVSILQSLQWVG